MTTIERPPGHAPPFVPPWLQDTFRSLPMPPGWTEPPTIMPMPPGWEEGQESMAFTLVEGRVRFGVVQ